MFYKMLVSLDRKLSQIFSVRDTTIKKLFDNLEKQADYERCVKVKRMIDKCNERKDKEVKAFNRKRDKPYWTK